MIILILLTLAAIVVLGLALMYQSLLYWRDLRHTQEERFWQKCMPVRSVK